MYKSASFGEIKHKNHLFDKYDDELENEKESNDDCLYVPEIDQITDKIYLGNYDAARMKEMLIMRGITHILVCGKNMEELYKDEFQYMVIPIIDDPNENISAHFPNCFEFIENSEKVFVHCQAGISRSVTMVIAYLMWKNKIDYRSSFKYVVTRRKVAFPNNGFIKQLKEFENEILKNKKYFIYKNFFILKIFN
jgi:hypothetical protein